LINSALSLPNARGVHDDFAVQERADEAATGEDQQYHQAQSFRDWLAKQKELDPRRSLALDTLW
jgi:hypothetical protein